MPYQLEMTAATTFPMEIRCILELNSINQKARWYHASSANPECRYILVATMNEIRLLFVYKSQSNGQLVIEDSNLTALPQNSPRMMIELEKNGRVFYCRETGKISELIFQDTSRLHDEENTLSNQVVQFF